MSYPPRLFPTICYSLALTLCFAMSLAAEDKAPAGFPPPVNTQPETIKPLTPAEALKSVTVPPGFKATLFAAEPAVQQPIAMAWDERGRLWIAECYTYAESGLNFDARQRDRIVILEDTDGDGQHDKRTVFWDQAQKLTSIEIGFGGVWALCAPYLLFIPDANRDDVPDGPPVIKLDGWDGGGVRHNIVNGLKWGPDGWLYGRHGILQTSTVGPPGASDSQRQKINCGIWRYHPTRTTFEAVCHGTTNPWGHDWDEHGELLMINTVIGHLWHVVPGARFRRMYGADFDSHSYQLLEQAADHFHWDQGEQWHDIRKIGVSPTTDKAGGGHAHSGLMVYLGANWPAEYRNSMFTVNYHGRRLNRDRLERKGAGLVGTHAPDFMNWGDPYFKGIDLTYGPDGGVYVLDWSDIGECHDNDGVHRTSGRIYKIIYGEPKKGGPIDLASASDAQLVEMQRHTNEWFVRQSRRLLQERAAAGKFAPPAAAPLAEAGKSPPAGATAEAWLHCERLLFTAFASDQLSEDRLIAALQAPQSPESYRAIAVRLLVDRGEVSAAAAKALADLAAKETAGIVRLHLASALQKLAQSQRLAVATPLTNSELFAADPVLPLMIWYGIEPLIAKDPVIGVQLIANTKSATLRRLAARRVTEELERSPGAVNELVALLRKLETTAGRLDLLQGMAEGLRGWRRAPAPATWKDVAAELSQSKDEPLRIAVRDLGVVFGEGRALEEVKKLALNEGADTSSRISALRTLIVDRSPELLPLLKKLAGDRLLAAEAIRGLASYSDKDVPQILLDSYNNLRPEARAEAINTLAARAEYAQELLTALEAGKISRKDLTAFHARQIRSFENAKLNEQLSKAWGDVRVTAEDKKKLIEQLKSTHSPEKLAKANLSQGRAVFTKTCASCHVLYGQGKTIGPDLTGGNRRNIDYLLENIVDPSASVAADFRATLFKLQDGRVFTAVIAEQNDKAITIQTAQERFTIAKSEIEESKPTGLSLMPDGILQPLTPEQVRDLFAYLMSTEQVPLAEVSAK